MVLYFLRLAANLQLRRVIITATCTLHGGVAPLVPCKVVLKISPTNYYYLKCTEFFVIMVEDFPGGSVPQWWSWTANHVAVADSFACRFTIMIFPGITLLRIIAYSENFRLCGCRMFDS